MKPLAHSPDLPLKVAYLINQYPMVSHTFIRREILALERQGLAVLRVALRGWAEPVPDPQDEAEQRRTRYVLRGGAAALAAAVLRVAVATPRRFVTALALALRMARRADRPWPVHLVYLAEACVMLGWLRQAGATHLHAHFGTNPAEVAMLVQALGGPPYSFTVHGMDEFDKPEFLHLGEKIRRAAFVVAVSSYGRAQLYRFADVAQWPKVQVVHCGLERDFHDQPVPAPAGPRLVCVARISKEKGHLLLVEAAGLAAARGAEFELVLAGDGELRPAIEARVIELGLQGRVRITGWISSAQVRDEILAARALVLASFYEGLPVVLMEAMALRRPVIATAVAGIPELVHAGVNGWLVPAGDVEALAAALQACLDCPDETLRRLGDAAHSRATERHDVDTEAARLAALFRAAPVLSGAAVAGHGRGGSR